MKRRVAALFMALVLCTSSLNVSAEEATDSTTYIEQADETEAAEAETEESDSEETEEAEESAEESEDSSESVEESSEEASESGEDGENEAEEEEEELVIVQEETTVAEEEEFLTETEGESDDDDEGEATNTENVALTISETTTYYDSISAALAEATAEATIKLLADVTEDVTITSGKTVTLDLNGHKLTNVSAHTITNNGTLTITDSSISEEDGTEAQTVGTVDNVTHACAALYNAPGATCTILAGNFTRSCEAGSSSSNNGGNSFYTIQNQGTMTFGSDVSAAAEDGEEETSLISVSNTGKYSSMIANGWQDGSKNTSATSAKMIINEGSFTGGLNSIKNDDYGVLTVNGGTFSCTSQYAVMNYNTCTITGGSFTSTKSAAVYNNTAETNYDAGTLTITGGEFTGTSAISNYNSGQVTITGGEFTGTSAISNYNSGQVTITGGEFTGTNYAIRNYNSGKVTISDGNFISTKSLYSSSAGTITVSGGTFSAEVAEKYCAEGYVTTETEEGYIVAGPYAAYVTGSDGNVAYYDSDSFGINTAISALKDGDTLSLLVDVTTSEALTVQEGVSVTLDLNGNTLSISGNPLTIYGALTICDTSSEKSGILSYSGSWQYLILAEGENASFTLNSGTLKNSSGYGVYCKDGGTAIVNDGVISSKYAPLSGNNTTGDMYFKVNGGELTAAYGPAIYMPGPVSLTITGGTLNGGISLRMGIVDISGGTINAITDNIDSPDDYYDYTGNAWLPDALYVFGGTYTSDNETMGNTLSINITGGEFICQNGEGSAVAIYDLGKVKQSASVEISGSAVLKTNATDRDAYQVLSLEDIGVTDSSYGITSGEVETAISGGTFSTEIDLAYCADGYVPIATTDENGNVVYMVEDKSSAAVSLTSNGETKYYTSLSEAIADVPVGDDAEKLGEATTIKILKDIDNAEGISIPSKVDLTIDFGGHTYILTGPGAGSTGTETQGFQLLKDSTIVMRNGTIRIAENANNIKRIIQNYANLTLEDMQIYAENQVGGEDYALSFNNGTITFKGNTSVYTTSADTIAFDVFYWSSYPNGTDVIFDESYTGTINGTILYDSTDATKASLTIAGNGEFNTILLSNDASSLEETPNISISGGTFEVQLDEEWCADGYILVENKNGFYEAVGPYAATLTDSSGVRTAYEEITDALDALSDGDTLTMLRDVTIEESRKIAKSVSIELNGHSLTIGDSDTVRMETAVTLTIAEGASVAITGDTGVVANYGTIVVYGTLDISELGIATKTDDGITGNGLLSQTKGLISLGAVGLFVAPSVWLTDWPSWTPGTASTYSDIAASGYIIVSAEVGAQVKCQDNVWTCTKAFVNNDDSSENNGSSENWGEYVAVGTSSGDIGGYYQTFAEAISAAQSGSIDTITLLDDVTIDTTADSYSTFIWSSGSLTIDPNGHSISTSTTSAESSPTETNTQLFLLKSGSLTLTGSGEIKDYAHRYVIRVTGSDDSSAENYSVLTIGENVSITAAGYPVQVYPTSTDGSGVAYGVVVNVAGTLTSEYTAALTVNGMVTEMSGENVATVNISGTLTSKAEKDDKGNVTSGDDPDGLYAGGYAIYNIKEGAVISGLCGIEIRAGVLNVSGGTISGIDDSVSSVQNGNGATTHGVGIAVVQHQTKHPVEVNISGGTITGSFCALYQKEVEDGDTGDYTMSVTDGYFAVTDDNAIATIYSVDCKNFITGGHFTDMPDESYLSDDFVYSTSAITLNGVTYLYGVVDTTSGDAGLMYSTDEDGELTVTLNGTYYYTGSAIKPNPVLKDVLGDGTVYTLKSGTDYKLSYKNNTNAAKSTATKAPTVIVKGIGNYSDLYQEITFTISPRDISEATATCADVKSANGEAESKPTVKYNGKTLKLNTAYTVKYSMDSSNRDALNRVTATATITGKGNFTGTLEVTYKVYYSKVSLTSLSRTVVTSSGSTTTLEDGTKVLPMLLVTIDDEGLTFNNASQKPLSVTVQIRTSEDEITNVKKATYETLTLNKDYTLSYSNNKNAGSSAKVKITGKGSFSGSATVYFSIAPASLADASIYVASPTKNVKASSLSSTVKLVLNGKTVTLKKGTAYTLEAVESNTDGYYAVKAVAKSSNYKDETTAYLYKVGKVSMTDEASRFTVEFADGYSDSYEYTGSAIKPKLVVKDTVYDRVLVSGTDYTLTYKNNTNAGTATITVKGKTNYSGSLQQTFTIRQKNISSEDITITLADVKKGQKIAYKSLATVKNGTKKLTYSSNFKITAAYTTSEDGTITTVSNGSKGTGEDFTIEISRTGTNYTGTATATVHGYLYAISSRAKVTVSPAYYTGTQLTPDFIVYDSSTKEILVEGTDYEVAYGENIKVGTKSGSIVLTGIGEYGGTAKTVRFAIRAKSIWDVLNSMFGLDL